MSTAVLQTKIDRCAEVYADHFGATASPIPWQQIITMLLSLLAGCVPVGSRLGTIQRPGPLKRLSMLWCIEEKMPEASAEEVGKVMHVLLVVGRITTADEAAALMGG